MSLNWFGGDMDARAHARAHALAPALALALGHAASFLSSQVAKTQTVARTEG